MHVEIDKSSNNGLVPHVQIIFKKQVPASICIMLHFIVSCMISKSTFFLMVNVYLFSTSENVANLIKGSNAPIFTFLQDYPMIRV
jgi:hypothetical protein